MAKTESKSHQKQKDEPEEQKMFTLLRKESNDSLDEFQVEGEDDDLQLD